MCDQDLLDSISLSVHDVVSERSQYVEINLLDVRIRSSANVFIAYGSGAGTLIKTIPCGSK